MKKLYLIASVLALLAVSCNKINDLESRVGSLEGRVNALETSVATLNENLDGLQRIVTALQNNDYLTTYNEIKDASGAVIGYELIFAKSGSVKIYHGKDGGTGPQGPAGPTGATPQIGIKQYTDGLFYWTLNGEWLLDATTGKMVLAVGIQGNPGTNGTNGIDGTPGTNGQNGKDGQDGITPQLRIQDGNWEISYDKGATWTQLGVATDIVTSDFFTSVAQVGGDLILTLRSGEVYNIPIGSQLSISYDSNALVLVKPGEERTIHYTITSSVGAATIEVLSSADVKAKTANESGLEGDIVLTVGEEITEYSKVVVLVTDGLRVITSRFTFEEEGMVVTDNTLKHFGADAGSLEIEFLTNTEFDVVIPEAFRSWMSVQSTKSMDLHGVTLALEANPGTRRTGTVGIVSKISTLRLDYTIVQDGNQVALRFTHTLAQFDAFPTMSGSLTGGTIYWGDGTSGPWNVFTHNYTDGAASHTVEAVTDNGLTQVEFATLTGITAVDVSQL